MRRLLIVSIALCLVLLCAGVALAMPHAQGPVDIDTWYVIEDEEPYITGGYRTYPDDSMSFADVEFYRNDFMFIGGYFFNYAGLTNNEVAGSYIFRSGLFVAFEYSDYPTVPVTFYILSTGYCWSWGDRGYLAFNVEYDLEYEVVCGYDVDFKLRTDALLIRGELRLNEFDNDYLDMDLAYQVGETLTVGGNVLYSSIGSLTLAAGATWRQDSWVFDLCVEDDGAYKLSGVYYLGDFGFGLEYNGDYYTLKAKYDTGDSRFTLLLSPEQDFYPMMYEIDYTKYF